MIEDTVLFGKVVTISDPDQIRRLNESPALSRLDNPDRLGAASVLFQNSAFFSQGNNYLAFVEERDPPFLDRLGLMQRQIKELNDELTNEDLAIISRLVKQKASDDELLMAFASIGGGNKFARVFEIDPAYLNLGRTMPLVPDMLVPDKLFHKDQIIAAHQEADIRARGDILQLHNSIASTLLNAGLIRETIMNPGKSVNDIITDISPLQVSLRLTNQETSLHGLLPESVPANTIVLFYIGAAAKATHNSTFTFGHGEVGEGARLCPYRKFIIPFLEKLRHHNSGKDGRDPHDPSVYDPRPDVL